MKKILVGTDTSASADLAVREAARLASADDAELLVLHVRSDASARDAGDPAERLVAVAETERVDTIVLGNRGTHGSWWRVRESVPNLVLRHAPCSVMIVDTRAAQ